MNTINFTGLNNSLVGPPVLGNLGGGSGDLSLPRITNFGSSEKIVGGFGLGQLSK